MIVVDVLRWMTFAVFAASALAALGSWAVRTRRIAPHSGTGRAIRRLTDPVLHPMERMLIRRGSNPQNAGWWLVGAALVGGIVLISLARWLVLQGLRFGAAGSYGPRAVIALVIYYAGQLVIIALIVRVIGSWFGIGRFNRWMRPAYFLTDWIVQPLRKVIPPIGMIDITPIVAWALIQFVALPLLLGIL
jgi:YggT family protein